jgi:hypothetical protein
MVASPQLPNRLREVLGREAGDALMTWLEEERSEREAVRSDFAGLRADFAALRGDLAELRQEMRAGFLKVSADLRVEIAREVHGLEVRLVDRINAVDKRVSETESRLMRWSFVFWVGAVGAIAALAGVLR